MKVSKVRLRRRQAQKRIDGFARALEVAALDLAHATWHPGSFSDAPQAVRVRRAALCEAAICFTAAVDGEDVSTANVTSIAKAAK
jgi:hypothetical protein